MGGSTGNSVETNNITIAGVCQQMLLIGQIYAEASWIECDKCHGLSFMLELSEIESISLRAVAVIAGPLAKVVYSERLITLKVVKYRFTICLRLVPTQIHGVARSSTDKRNGLIAVVLYLNVGGLA